MCWADGSKVKVEVDQQLVLLLGPKTDADRQPVVNSKASKAKETKPEVKKPKESQGTNRISCYSYSHSDYNRMYHGNLLIAEGDKLTPQERIMAIMKKLPFHKPGENFTTDGYPTSKLALDLLAKHAELTKRQVS